MALIGRSFIVRVTPKGEIVELNGLDKMFLQMAEKVMVAEDELISKAPMGTCDRKDKNSCAASHKEMSAEERAKKRIENLNKRYGSREKRKQALKEMIKKYPFFSKRQLNNMVRNVIMGFAGRGVGIGDSWEGKISPTYVLLPEISATYMLKEDKQGAITINVNSIVNLDKIPAGSKAGAGPQMKMSGSYQETSQIDKSSGWIINKKATMLLSGQVTQQGMTMPMSIESVITVEPIESVGGERLQ